MQELSLKTSKKEELIDITSEVRGILSKSEINNGICLVQTQHTTAGLTINENADPDVKQDILKGLSIFDKENYEHGEGNSPAHIKSSLVGSSVSMIIRNNELQLGTWQGIMFCEFDGPRNRKIIVEVVGNGSM
jgi:secondary thiamine-phosphate synthase enzyme